MNKNPTVPPPNEKKSAAGPASPSIATEATSVSKESPRDALLEVVHGLRRQGVTEKDLVDVLVMKLLMRIDCLFGRIDEAFSGQPFNPEVPPDAAANQHRVNAYIGNFAQATKLLGFALELAKSSGSIGGKPNDTSSEKRS